MTKKNEKAKKPAGSNWNTSIVKQNADPNATEALREFMKEPNTPSQYRVGLNPTKPNNSKAINGEAIHEAPENF